MLFPFLVILPGLIALAITRPVSNQPAQAGGPTSRTEQYGGGFMGRVPVTAGGAASAPTGEKYASTSEPLIPVQTSPSGELVRDKNGDLELDYNMIIPQMLLHYFPSGNARPRIDGPVS